MKVGPHLPFWVKQKLWPFAHRIIAKCEVSLNFCARLYIWQLCWKKLSLSNAG